MTNYLSECLLRYIKNGNTSSHGLCNYFDIGYYEDGNWETVLVNQESPRAVRFDSANNPKKIICEGLISPDNLVINDYTDKEFFIRVSDTTASDTVISEIRMSTKVEEYFQSNLSSTVEILLQWEISFEEGEE